MSNSRLKMKGIELKVPDQKSKNDFPLVSIVTVVFNSVNSLEKTIISVIDQTYENLEYIIIDGGSTDGTLDLIKKYSDKIHTWISESDNGLYYAMNKGLFLAKGKWINFLNSGDCFCQPKTIENIFSQNPEEGVIYGDVLFSFDGKNEVYVKAKPLKYFWKGMQFVHQATFVSTNIMKNFPFDTKYKIIADYNSLYHIFLSGIDFQYKDLPICKFLAGGVSDNNPKVIVECQNMIFPIHPKFYVRLYYYYRYIECTLKFNFAKGIGQSNYALFRRIKKKTLDFFTGLLFKRSKHSIFQF